MKSLTFLGIDTGFGLNNTSAFAIEDDKLILFDCGTSTANKLIALDKFNGFLKQFNKFDVLISHMHADHVGGLPLLIQYIGYILKNKTNIYCMDNNITKLLDITGIEKELYNIGIDLKYEFIKTTHAKDLPAYGVIASINNKKILYTGDSNDINSFKEYIDGIDELYIEMSYYKSDVHLYLEDNIEYLNSLDCDVYLMHVDEKDKIEERIKNTNIKLASDNGLMNKEDILNILHIYNLDKDEYIVISSANLVLRGLKEHTRDIDISVSKNYYNRFLHELYCEFERTNEYDHTVYFINGIINFGIDYYDEDKEYIEDIPVQNLEKTKILKQKLGRKKDIEDLKHIPDNL